VTLEGTGKLVKLSPANRNITNTLDVGMSARAIAVTHDYARIFVTRFISPVDRGQVTEVNASSFTVTRVFDLMQDTTTVDGENRARGVPNYITAITISPDARRAWTASKKDNTLRGTFRDGLALNFENTVRPLTSQLDLLGNSEVVAGRIDY